MREYSKSEQQFFRHLISDKMNLCGCGSSMWEFIRHLLEISEDHDKNGSFYDAPEAQWPWKEFAGKVIDSWGLTEHGTGIGYAWLTADGKKLLAFLRDVGDISDDLPEFTHSCSAEEEW